LLTLRLTFTQFLIKNLNINNVSTAFNIFLQKARRKLLGRQGLIVALLGPDGSGKTTLAEYIVKQQLFNAKYVYMGRDQFLIPTRKILKSVLRLIQGRPGSKPVSPSASSDETLIPVTGESRHALDVVRLLHDMADFYLRYLVFNHFPYRYGKLIVNDRYVYDLMIGNEQVQKHPFFRKYILRLFPKPDMVFILSVPANDMFVRKGEHTPGFLQAQKVQYGKLQTTLKNCHIIQTDVAIETSVNRVIALIWRAYFRNLASS